MYAVPYSLGGCVSAGARGAGSRTGDVFRAVISHVQHLIVYSIVGTASDLEAVPRSGGSKDSAGSFRGFTRTAASNPTIWRDIFLFHREAVREIIQRLTEDRMDLQRAIRRGGGSLLYDIPRPVSERRWQPPKSTKLNYGYARRE